MQNCSLKDFLLLEVNTFAFLVIRPPGLASILCGHLASEMNGPMAQRSEFP